MGNSIFISFAAMRLALFAVGCLTFYVLVLQIRSEHMGWAAISVAVLGLTVWAIVQITTFEIRETIKAARYLPDLPEVKD